MNFSKKNILLVEDDILIALLEIKQLERYGYLVKHLTSGEMAIDCILHNSFPVDIILMDIDLGLGMDGIQAAEKILAIKDIPLLFLSSHIEPELVEKTEIVTSYGYVVKNSGITILDTSIKMAFKLFDAYQRTRFEENRYRLLVESLNEGIWQINEDAKTVFVNSRMPLMLGYSTHDMLGESFYRFVNKQSKEKAERCLEKCKIGIQEQHELEFIKSDGTSLYAILELSPIVDDSGSFMGSIAGVMDITERRIAQDFLRISEENLRVHQIELQMQNDELKGKHMEMEALQLKYYNLYDIAPAGFFTLNEESKILEANLAGGEMVGIPRTKLINKKFTSFINGEDQDTFFLYQKRVFDSGRPQSCKLRLKNVNGDCVHISMKSIAALGEDGSLACRIIAIKEESISQQLDLKLN
jgi:PAS domain S-box-containing protein